MADFNMISDDKTSKKKDAKDKPTAREIALQYIHAITKGQPTAIVHHQGRTYLYDGTRYIEKTDMALSVRRFLMRHGFSHSNTAVSCTVGDVQAIANDVAQFHPTMPFFSAADDFPKTIIAYQNGLLDVDSYLAGSANLLPHTPNWVSTVCLPYNYDQSAQCPQWLQFLNDVFNSDSGRIGLWQEWCGYCLLPDTSQHKLLVKIGPPRAGKGTSDRVLQALLGDENSTGYNLHCLASQFGLTQLMSKHVAFVGEIQLANSRDKYRILETLNSIVGSDPVLIDTKFGQPISMRLPVRFNLSCNEMPNFVDPSGALASRLLVLDFCKSFAGNEDRHLEAKLLSEIEGINNWALQGLARLKQQGKFSDTAMSEQLSMDFRRESSDAFAFIQDRLEVHHSLSPGNLPGVEMTDQKTFVLSSHLLESYSAWCVENDRQQNFKWLTKNLQAMLPGIKVTRRTEDKQKVRVYEGIGLRLGF